MIRRLLLFTLVAVVLSATGSRHAAAHAGFDRATPGPGQVLASAPARVDIYVTQELRKISGRNEIVVAGPDGQRVDDGATLVDDADRHHFSVGLRPTLPVGRYIVSFKTLSDEDAEADHGAFAFYLGIEPTPAQSTQDAKLSLTSDREDPPGAGDVRSRLLAALAGALVLAALVAAGWLILRRRQVQA
jgi:methionine-rich copper-binding protein CopC